MGCPLLYAAAEHKTWHNSDGVATLYPEQDSSLKNENCCDCDSPWRNATWRTSNISISL